ncbi:MAG: sodium/sulfate symporter, partial [Zetaproteobacteria bacterium]
YDSPLNAAEPPLRPALDLVEALHAALAEREVDTVLLYAGFSPEPDRGLGRLAPVIALLRRHLGHRQLAVEATAPEDFSAIDAIYAAGADMFVCNLEAFDREVFARLCPGKAAHGGQEAIWRALRHARRVFRAGSVASQLIVGAEPVGQTQAGIDALVSEGIVPLLVPLRPLPETPLAEARPPALDTMEQAARHWYARLARTPMPIARWRAMGRVLTPMESRAFLGRRPTLAERWQESILGRRWQGIAEALRRSLRVQHENGRAQIRRGPLVRLAWSRGWPLASLLALLVVAWMLGRTAPSGVPAAIWRAWVLFGLAGLLWATRLVPLPVASLFVLGALPASGILPAKEAFSGFAHPAVFFLLGAMLLAAALKATGAARWLCVRWLQGVKSSRGALARVFGLSFALAMLMPEHAAAALTIPIAAEAQRLSDASRPFLWPLAAAWGAVIGGVATMLGGARAPLALAVLQAFGGRGFSFAEWMLAAAPIAFALGGLALWRLVWALPAVDARRLNEALK